MDENLRNAGPQTYGVIAISVSRLLNRGNLYFAGDLERLGDRVQPYLTENADHCQRAVMRHPSICGVLFHAATPSDREGALFRMSYSVFGDGGRPSAAFQQLGDHLRPIYEIE